MVENKKVLLRQPGVEPGSTAWKATMLTATPLTLLVVMVIQPLLSLWLLNIDFFVSVRPSPPSGRITISKISSDTVILEWNPPRDVSGRRRVTHYDVEYRDFRSHSWTSAATVDAYTRTVTISGLVENVEYIFRIFSVNDLGRSDPIEVDLTLTADDRRKSGSIDCSKEYTN